MTNLVLNYDNGVTVTIDGNSNSEIVEALRGTGLDQAIHNQLYFSSTSLQRTGEGWIRLEDMNDHFIVNAFVQRLGEVLRESYRSIDDDNKIEKLDFTNTLFPILNALYISGTTLEHINLPVLHGLLVELSTRLDNAFDSEDETDVPYDDNAGIPTMNAYHLLINDYNALALNQG